MSWFSVKSSLLRSWNSASLDQIEKMLPLKDVGFLFQSNMHFYDSMIDPSKIWSSAERLHWTLEHTLKHGQTRCSQWKHFWMTVGLLSVPSKMPSEPSEVWKTHSLAEHWLKGRRVILYDEPTNRAGSNFTAGRLKIQRAWWFLSRKIQAQSVDYSHDMNCSAYDL